MATESSQTTNFIPLSSSYVSVSAINPTQMTGLPWNLFFGPKHKGVSLYDCPGYCFLVTHTSGKRLLFDLSVAQNFRQVLPPPQLPLIDEWEANGAKITVTQQVHDILSSQGITLTSNDALLWSHSHWDHMGDVSQFPGVPLIVGKEMIETWGHGYPEVQDAPYRSACFEGRQTILAEFGELEIGGMKAWDYFGDGSFYILDAPGHSPGHLNGLARVGPDSLILLGADAFHHGSQLRPNAGEPLPKFVNTNVPGFPSPCSSHIFDPLYAEIASHKEDAYKYFADSSTPGYTPCITIGWGDDGFTVATDPQAALDTIDKIIRFDADERVFCFASHDKWLDGIVDTFPKAIDNWKEKGWKDQARWTFLADFAPALQ